MHIRYDYKIYKNVPGEYSKGMATIRKLRLRNTLNLKPLVVLTLFKTFGT